MKRMTIAFFTVFLLAGCSFGNGDEADRDKESIKALTARVEKLEQETNALRKGLAEALGGIAAIEKGLARLEGAESPGKPTAEKSGNDKQDKAAADEDVTKEELDSKARQFANESLERLLDISRSVLDRIEQELDKIEEPPVNEEAPKPEEKTI